jgi:Zn-dependent protease with chaperone function
MLLPVLITAWMGPAASAQSVTPLETQIAKEVDAQIAYTGVIGSGDESAGPENVNGVGSSSHINVRMQTACETEMLQEAKAREVVSGKAYRVVTELAAEYGRTTIPHIYVFPGSWNMIYIAGSTVVDGQGKILIGRRAIELFDVVAFRGFLGHEMAHLVNDKAAYGCQDYIVRDPRTEADADAFAARVLGTQPVEAFLKRVLALPEGQYTDAKGRLDLLRSKRAAWTGD